MILKTLEQEIAIAKERLECLEKQKDYVILNAKNNIDSYKGKYYMSVLDTSDHQNKYYYRIIKPEKIINGNHLQFQGQKLTKSDDGISISKTITTGTIVMIITDIIEITKKDYQKELLCVFNTVGTYIDSEE
jgi:hypothetical protein